MSTPPLKLITQPAILRLPLYSLPPFNFRVLESAVLRCEHGNDTTWGRLRRHGFAGRSLPRLHERNEHMLALYD